MDIRANILVDTIALMIAAVALIDEARRRQLRTVYQNRFRGLLVVNCMILVMDLLAWLCDGRMFAGSRVLGYFLNTGYYAMQITYCWLWLIFAYCWAYDVAQLSRAVKLTFALPLLVELALLIANFFIGEVFIIDVNNHYRRGNCYSANLIPYVVYTLSAFYVLARAWLTSSDIIKKRHSVVLLIGMMLPACGSIVESRSYGMTFTWPLAALSLLLIYLSTQQQQNALDKAEAANAKAELAESQMSIMLSQIQPHFLYNSLAVIAELCKSDPPTARYATLQFSAFLRGNMNSLTMNRPIAFEHELSHTQNYTSLEQLRFPDRLRVEYKIEAVLFKLPTLTLQPIVENAVRYGVTKRPEGGTVTVRSYETDTSFIITVTDDGLGFDPLVPKEDGRTHIGISNVRDRLKRMVNGTLQITSTPNVGTVAVITIPKGAY